MNFLQNILLFICRIQKRLADEDAKRTRLRQEKERLLAERERLHQEQFQMRISDMKDRQFMVGHVFIFELESNEF